jgi:hypothetical protein
MMDAANKKTKREGSKMAEKIVDYKFKDLREAVVALNEWIAAEAEDMTKIKLIGSTKPDILADFRAAMDAIEDVDGKFPGPKIALTFYNALIELEEKAEKKEAKGKAEKEEAPEKAEKPKKEKAEKVAKPKKEKVAKPAKEKEEKGPGVIASILELIRDNGPITKKEILENLTELFPDREPDKMAKTVQVQLGGKKHPCRMEADKGVTFEVTEDGKYSLVE